MREGYFAQLRALDHFKPIAKVMRNSIVIAFHELRSEVWMRAKPLVEFLEGRTLNGNLMVKQVT